jgi:endonuclease/exonuclease/phosphatase family metal-dependent hydrolase
MTKLVSTLLKAVNIFVAILYLLACLIPFLPADEYWMIAVLGLIFPLLFIVMIIFLLVWAMARSRWILLPLVSLLLGWKQVSVVFGFSTKDFTIAKKSDTLRVLTWNVSSWGETSKPGWIPNSDEHMINLINEQQPDILCFQEFYDRRAITQGYSIVRILKTMGYEYSYFVRSIYGHVKYKTGVAILSKYPILDTAKFEYGEKVWAEHLIYADILFNEKKIRVFTTHLQSVRFEKEEYTALNKIKHSDESGIKDSRTIMSKLKKAYQYRGAQADILHQKIKESPYPVIVCGDFNDVPNSYTYFKVKDDLQDAFLEKGSRIGRTFRFISPTLRIDYILADRKLEVAQFNRIIAPYSDHYGVVADLNVH